MDKEIIVHGCAWDCPYCTCFQNSMNDQMTPRCDYLEGDLTEITNRNFETYIHPDCPLEDKE